MNIDTIGYNAGLVWNALNEADALGLRQIKTRNFIWHWAGLLAKIK